MSELRDAFELLIDLPAPERERRLQTLGLSAQTTATLRAMLDAEARALLIDAPIDHAIERFRTGADEASRLVGRMLGPFRVVSMLGEGGSSTVFRAEREAGPGTQTVALKVMRAGLFSISAERRFRRENAILAQLDHPDIARLIEGGVSESGIPYIAMELVEGEPITRAAAALSLGLHDRLRLFSRLCRAVGAAHAALVIHRDIKPSNVLVDRRGKLKVLDFGIAKPLESDTEELPTRTISLTPEYAAPEQFRAGHQTVAVDVFSLGVLLAELLTGQRVRGRAISAALAESVDAVPAGLPARRDLARQLRGDLDAIVQRATQEEPARRYASVEALADDVDRHVAGQPIRARAPSAWYRAFKFIGRHRVGASMSLLTTLVLLASLAIALRQAQIARQEALRANTVRDLIVSVFESARASLPRDQRPTPEQLVAQAEAQLSLTADADEATRVELDRTLGEVWLSMSNFEAAQAAFARVQSHARERGDVDLENQARVALAEAAQRQGRNEEAKAELAAIVAAAPKQPSTLLRRAHQALAEAQAALGEHADALVSMREAERIAIALHGPDSAEALHMGFEVGGTLAVGFRYAEAAAMLQPLIDRWRAGGRPEDQRLALALHNLVVSQFETGKADDAIAHMRQLLELRRRIYSGPHEAVAGTLRNLAGLLQLRGDYAQAVPLLEEALAMQKQVLGADHVQIARTLDTLGVALVNDGRAQEGEPKYAEVIALCERTRLQDDVCPRSLANLGQSYFERGLLQEAAVPMRAALERRLAMFGEEHANVAISRSRLAALEAERGNAQEAIALAQASFAVLEKAGRADSREGAIAKAALAAGLFAADRGGEALEAVDAALVSWKDSYGHERRAAMLILRARILARLARPADARQAALDAGVAIRDGALSPAQRTRLRDQLRDAMQ